MKGYATLMIKITFTPKQLNNPESAFQYLSKKVISSSKKKEQVDPSSFYAMLTSIGDKFEKNSQRELMNKNSKRLAEQLVSFGNGTLAGIIYSFLIKLNCRKTEVLEQLAYNALAVAKRFHDPVHIMARCEDLNKVLVQKDSKSPQRLKILFEEKRALSDICKNYDKIENRYKTITRKLKPVDVYENMLCNVKIRIAKYLKDSNKVQALQELSEANEIATKLEKTDTIKAIARITKEIKK